MQVQDATLPALASLQCIVTLGLSTSSGKPLAVTPAFRELFTLFPWIFARVTLMRFLFGVGCEGPNPSSKSSSNVTFAPQPLLANAGQQHGVAATLGMAAPGMAATEAGRFFLPRGVAQQQQQLENWGDSVSGVVVTSPLTETSTDLDDSGDMRHRASMGGGGGDGDGAGQRRLGCVDSSDRRGDQKMSRRLAQNREAARKSRIKKKAYLQQLESSRSKLEQLEQELQRARQQGMFIAGGSSGDHSSGGALAFDLEYARWLDDHQRHINNLRVAVVANMNDDELRILVESVMLHYDDLFSLKSFATKSDVFHVMSGMWMSPAERFFMWLGGFRSSELLKVLASQLEPLTDQQLMGICSLQQSSQQAEDALSQGMEALQQGLAETLAAAAGVGPLATGADNVTNYMGQMAIAMGKLSTLENFLRQGDLLRQQTLQQLHRILTTRQAARALLVISDYFSRLRALSSLWLARPRE
ncbi:transcription factor TGAL3-like [Lolium rigidum]|uniref:transcription factor TGAL3-like n=1 Tax=Lolium rigidum TaxID=89674 RepID=UPI001F5CAFA3|nr:transcription factor TGAL3-like [Lolium rigidum]